MADPARSRNHSLLVLAALAAGLLAGIAAPRLGDGWREPAVRAAATVGGLWLDGLKMTVVPLIFALLVSGIVGSAQAALGGRVAARSILWFAAVLTASAVFGALAMPALLAAAPLPSDAAGALRAGLTGIDSRAAAAAVPTVEDFLRGLVPANPVAAAASGNILQLVVFAALFAFALTRIEPARATAVTALLDAVGAALLVVIGWVLWLAPLGVFALAFVVAAGAGGAAVAALAHYVLLVAAVGALVMLAGYVLAWLGAGWPPGRFARAMIPPQAVAVSTQSSLASLPAMLKAAGELGVAERQADVTLPLAVALFRATGPAMNMAVVLYVAHWLGLELSGWQLAAGVAVAATTTYGTVSLPGQLSFVTSIAPIAMAMGVPVEPLALLIAVETIPDIVRTAGNVTMDVAVTGAVARGSAAADDRGWNAASAGPLFPSTQEGPAPVTRDSKLDPSILPGAMSAPPQRELEKELKKHPEDPDLKVDVGSDESMDASDPPAATQPGCGRNEPAPSSGFPE